MDPAKKGGAWFGKEGRAMAGKFGKFPEVTGGLCRAGLRVWAVVESSPLAASKLWKFRRPLALERHRRLLAT